MKTFIVGDYRTGTGPANVTKEYIRCFPKGTMYQKMTKKITRVPELFVKTMICDCVLFSGYSAQNVLCIKFAKLFKKKTAYLVHGAITYENKINDAENKRMSEVEEETLLKADLLLGVSEKFAGWLKANYPQYEKKIDYVTNGVDFEYLRSLATEFVNENALRNRVSIGENNVPRHAKVNSNDVKEPVTRDIHKILSVGGGMPRKKIIHICEAIDLYNKNKPEDEKVTLSVIGAEGKDTDAIKEYDFVDYLGMVSPKRKEELYRECGLFVQNSCFETFGLAVFEALMSGCSILTSQVAGALDLLKDADDRDIIYNYEDVNEIASKIEGLINEPNCVRLKQMINEKNATWEARSEELLSKLNKLVNE